jgi:hypothetical protein
MSTTSSKLNGQLCTHSYNEAVERIARLASYSTSRNLKIIGFGDYFSIAEELCKKDLIILAISIRRLAEMTKSIHALKNKRIRAGNKNQSVPLSDSQENFWNIIGNIIHGVEIDVFKDIGKYVEKDMFKAVNNMEEIDAAICIKSDKFSAKIQLTDFLKCLNTYLEEAEEILSDNRIFVGSLYN